MAVLFLLTPLYVLGLVWVARRVARGVSQGEFMLGSAQEADALRGLGSAHETEARPLGRAA